MYVARRSRGDYDSTKDQAEASTSVASGALSANQTYYWRIGAVNKDGTETLSSIFSFSTGSATFTQTTVFVNGDLTIDDNLTYDVTKVAFFVVNGQIKIKSTVTTINAYLYAENGITTSYDTTNDVAPLIITGGVAIGGGANGQPVVINFNRNTSNPGTGPSPCPCAAERVVYDPRILVGLTQDPSDNRFGGANATFTEVSP